MPRTLIWLAVLLLATLFGGEMLLTLLEEGVDLIVDVTNTGFMLIYERVFGLPYEKAQGRAAWSSLGLLILLAVFGAWRLAPRVKRTSDELRQWFRGMRAAVGELWRSAPWYQKLAYMVGTLLILAALVMVI